MSNRVPLCDTCLGEQISDSENSYYTHRQSDCIMHMNDRLIAKDQRIQELEVALNAVAIRLERFETYAQKMTNDIDKLIQPEKSLLELRDILENK